MQIKSEQTPQIPQQRIPFALIGTSRYTIPLDSTARAKLELLNTLGTVHAFGFGPGSIPSHYHEPINLYLLPARYPILLRYLLMPFFLYLGALWVALRHGVRIFIAQGPIDGAPAAWAAGTLRLCGVRIGLVMESHGDFIDSIFLQRRVPWPALSRKLRGLLAEFSIAQSSVLRAVSTSTSRQLGHYAPDKPLLIFPAWTNIELFLKSYRSRAEHRGEQILFCGVITHLKGVDLLLQAFAEVRVKHPSATLKLAGKLEEGPFKEELKALIEEFALQESVTFLGVLPQEQLSALMARSSIFILPSRSEGLGRVIFEAQAAGCAVIASDVGGIPDLIQHDLTGILVTPGSKDAVKKALLELLEDPARCQKLGDKGHEFASDFFSCAGYRENYRNLLNLAARTVGI